jgi:2-dehydro-3-deoxyphosphooctonate aldolase (KDO 8-P synthase)
MSVSHTFSVGSVSIGDDSLVVIGGPCVIEHRDRTLETARYLADICQANGVGFIFKASYLKANRTSVHSFTGPGVDEGL